MIKKLFIISVHSPFDKKRPFRYLSAAIRAATESKWNHIDTLPFYENGSWLVMGMDPKLTITHPDKFQSWADDKIIEVHQIDMHLDPGKATLLVDVLQDLSPKYDYRGTLVYQLLYNLGRKLNRAFGTEIKWIGPNEQSSSRKFYCSEFAGYIMNKLGLGFSDWFKLSPGDLNKLMNERPKVFKKVYEGPAKDLPL